MQGERQDLPVARLHVRGAGPRIAQASAIASNKAARAGRAVGRGGLVLGKGLAMIAIPMGMLALLASLGGGNRFRDYKPPEIKVPTVRFDDKYFRGLVDQDIAKLLRQDLSASEAYMKYVYLRSTRPFESGPAHEPVHPTERVKITW